MSTEIPAYQLPVDTVLQAMGSNPREGSKLLTRARVMARSPAEALP